MFFPDNFPQLPDDGFVNVQMLNPSHFFEIICNQKTILSL